MIQLSIELARAARDDGIERAVEHANADVAGWSDLALAYIKFFAAQNKEMKFTGLDIRLASVKYGLIQPVNPKAWGGPVNRAVRAGVIKRVGTVPDPNRHCNPVPLWASA